MIWRGWIQDKPGRDKRDTKFSFTWGKSSLVPGSFLSGDLSSGWLTRILPVPVWPDMSSPAQSFASDMKSPSGRPPSGFWPWQQEHFVLFGDIVFYLADEVFGQELHFGYKHHIWSLIIYELVPSLPVISVFLPPPGFSSAPLGLTHSGAEKWWEWLAYNILPFS